MNKKVVVNVSKKAAEHNLRLFKSLIKPRTKLWAVVKSNAYGHGLLGFSKLMADIGADGFCVDSVVEGVKLRKNGIKKPILVLGPTLPNFFSDAVKNNITITVSNEESLKQVIKSKHKPKFHLKIDTGMHRQGFYTNDLRRVIKILRAGGYKSTNHKNNTLNRAQPSGGMRLEGIYTHFASAKDLNYPTYTENQFADFQNAIKILEGAGFKNLIKHCAATGGTLINQKYHLDAVRIGIGLYGLWPSKELQIQMSDKLKLKPVLSWQSIISEIKYFKKGDYIGYDLVEKIRKPTKAAIVPIGYWHGYDRRLSSCGYVSIKGKRAKVLGRVSMDIVVVDITDIPAKTGDTVGLINNNVDAYELAEKVGTTHYEIITRINPLIERRYI